MLRIRHGLRRITETASVCNWTGLLNEGWVDVGPIVEGGDPARNKRSLLCHRLCHDLGYNGSAPQGEELHDRWCEQEPQWD